MSATRVYSQFIHQAFTEPRKCIYSHRNDDLPNGAIPRQRVPPMSSTAMRSQLRLALQTGVHRLRVGLERDGPIRSTTHRYVMGVLDMDKGLLPSLEIASEQTQGNPLLN